MKKLYFILFFLCGLVITNPTHAAYSFYRQLTVTSTASVASGTNSNFPMLVSSTLVSWESTSTGAGARIQNLCTAPNGGQEPCDLIFSTSTACNAMNFETEKYVSSTGALVDWVNVPTMVADAVIYACYGNLAVNTDQSHPSSTWNSNYSAVYHFATASTTLDSTSNSKSAASIGTVTATTTQIDGGIFHASSSNPYMNVSSTAALDLSATDFTVSAWVNVANGQQNYAGLVTKGGSSNDWGFGENAGTSDMYWYQGGTGAGNFLAITNGFSALTGTGWNYITVNYAKNSTTTTYFLNGVSNTTGHVKVPTQNAGFSLKMNASRDPLSTAGYTDEVEIAKVLQTPSWILTEYNNQSSPSTFYSVGSETPVSSPGIGENISLFTIRSPLIIRLVKFLID